MSKKIEKKAKASNAPAKPAATVQTKPTPEKKAKEKKPSTAKTVFGHVASSARGTIDLLLLKGVTEKNCVKEVLAKHTSRTEKSATALFHSIVKENRAKGHTIDEKDGVFTAKIK
jgi:hypothetical protein